MHVHLLGHCFGLHWIGMISPFSWCNSILDTLDRTSHPGQLGKRYLQITLGGVRADIVVHGNVVSEPALKGAQ